MADLLPPVREILAERAGEEMALNDRYLTRRWAGSCARSGFDRRWVAGEGAHLIDSEGQRYLDLISGYGVFALGRNHPDVIAAVAGRARRRAPANLPQLGVTLLSGRTGRAAARARPGSVAAMVPANTGTEAVEAAIKISRAATGRGGCCTPITAFTGSRSVRCRSTATMSSAPASGRCCPAATAVPFGDAGRARSASSRAETWRR